MGNLGPAQIGYDAKRRILPGVLSSSPRRAQPTRPLAPVPSDTLNMQTLDGSPQPTRIDSRYTRFGDVGDSPGAGGTSNALGTTMGNNAAANIGMTGLLSALSGIPSALSALGQGAPQGAVGNALLGSTMGSMFGPIGMVNSLLGMAYSGYKGSKAATSQGLTSTGTAAADATKALSTPFGLIGNFGNYIASLFNPHSTSATAKAISAALKSDEAIKSGVLARTGKGFTGLSFTNPDQFAPDQQAMAALMADLAAANAPISAEDAIMGMPAYGQRGGISNRGGGVSDPTAIGGRWGGVVGHQGADVGGNQGGDPGTGVGYGGGFGDIGSPTGQGEGDDD